MFILKNPFGRWPPIHVYQSFCSKRGRIEPIFTGIQLHQDDTAFHLHAIEIVELARSHIIERPLEAGIRGSLRTEGIEPQRLDWSAVSLYSERGALVLDDWQQEPLSSYTFNSQIPETLCN